MEPIPRPPRGPRPHRKAGLGTDRWERDFQRWQTQSPQPRTERQVRRLPAVLDEQPKAWMSRALLHEEDVDTDVPHGNGQGAQVMSSLEAAKAEVAALSAELAEIEAAEKKDRVAQQHSAEARQALHEAERAQFARQLADLERRKAVAKEAASKVVAEVAAEEARCKNVIATMSEPVERLGQQLREREAEVRDFAKQQDDLAVERRMREPTLRARLEELTAALEEVELDNSALAWEAKQRRHFQRWELLSAMLLQKEYCQALEAGEEELREETGQLEADVQAWRDQKATNQDKADSQRAEVAALCGRAAQLEEEVETILADFLTLAWNNLPRAISPRLS